MDKITLTFYAAMKDDGTYLTNSWNSTADLAKAKISIKKGNITSLIKRYAASMHEIPQLVIIEAKVVGAESQVEEFKAFTLKKEKQKLENEIYVANRNIRHYILQASSERKNMITDAESALKHWEQQKEKIIETANSKGIKLKIK